MCVKGKERGEDKFLTTKILSEIRCPTGPLHHRLDLFLSCTNLRRSPPNTPRWECAALSVVEQPNCHRYTGIQPHVTTTLSLVSSSPHVYDLRRAQGSGPADSRVGGRGDGQCPPRRVQATGLLWSLSRPSTLLPLHDTEVVDHPSSETTVEVHGRCRSCSPSPLDPPSRDTEGIQRRGQEPRGRKKRDVSQRKTGQGIHQI